MSDLTTQRQTKLEQLAKIANAYPQPNLVDRQSTAQSLAMVGLEKSVIVSVMLT